MFLFDFRWIKHLGLIPSSTGVPAGQSYNTVMDETALGNSCPWVVCFLSKPAKDSDWTVAMHKSHQEGKKRDSPYFPYPPRTSYHFFKLAVPVSYLFHTSHTQPQFQNTLSSAKQTCWSWIMSWLNVIPKVMQFLFFHNNIFCPISTASYTRMFYSIP